MNFFSFIISVSFFFSIVACKKNKDKNPPIITFTSPLRHATFNAQTNLHLVAKITDDKELQYVKVNIRSIDGSISICDQLDFNNCGTSFDIDRYINIGDIHTPTGEYQIIIQAFDGTNLKKSYLEINVIETPRQLKKLIIVRKSGSGSIAVDSLVGTSFSNFLNITSDHSSSAINNYHQLLYVCGKKSGLLNVYQLTTNSPYWSISPDMPTGISSVFYFNQFSNDQLLLWQSLASSPTGKLKAYNNNGIAIQNIAMQSNHHANTMCITSDKIVVSEASDLIGGTNYLSSYFTSGYALDETVVAPFLIMKIYQISSTEFLVLGNVSGQGELRIYNTTTNGFWEQVNIPSGKLYDAAAISDDDFIIAHQSGLLTFKHSTTNLVNLTADSPCQFINYDNYSGTLYGASGSNLKVYHAITGAVLSTFTASDSIHSILMHYNK